MKEPVAVLISDIHYNMSTLQVADAALRQAVKKANQLDVQLIICGDLHDSKANVRGECMIAVKDTLSRANRTVFVLRGNHDSLNERSQEHSLVFLPHPLCQVITDIEQTGHKSWFIAYQHDPEALRKKLASIPKGSTIIMHQGIEGSNSGDYIKDKSAINKEDVAGMRVISGHYHQRQDIPLPDGGLWSYVGNPYTLNFAEAKDPAKGFQVLYDDGSLEFIPTNLRRHYVYETDITTVRGGHQPVGLVLNPDDIVWVKIKGPSDQLATLTKELVAHNLALPGPFKLDLIPDDTTSVKEVVRDLPQDQLLDSLIDGLSNTTQDRKDRLKDLWKQFSKE